MENFTKMSCVAIVVFFVLAAIYYFSSNSSVVINHKEQPETLSSIFYKKNTGNVYSFVAITKNKEKIYLYAPKEIFCIDYYEQALKSLKLLKAN